MLEALCFGLGPLLIVGYVVVQSVLITHEICLEAIRLYANVRILYIHIKVHLHTFLHKSDNM